MSLPCDFFFSFFPNKSLLENQIILRWVSFCFLSPIVFINSGVIFVFQLSFHLSNYISDGLPTLIFIPNCSPLLNIKDSMFRCTFHSNNAVGGQ